MERIPFLRPNLVKSNEYAVYLTKIEESRTYSNYGPLNCLLEKRILHEIFQSTGAATTVSNATIGLMLSIHHCKRPTGKYAVMPSFSFAAAPLAAIWCGLTPYFLDIDSEDWCMAHNQLNHVIESIGDDIGVIVPYSAFGTYMDTTYYRELHKDGYPVVIDAAASLGTTNNDVHFGHGFPGAVVFSFHATKPFGIGEGGLVYSGDRTLVSRIRRSGNFGLSENRESEMLGLNSKISEYTAAIALATLDVYPYKILRRKQINHEYIEAFKRTDLIKSGWSFQKMTGSTPFSFVSVLCPPNQKSSTFVQQLAHYGVEARTYFSPALHKHKQFWSCPHETLTVTDHIAGRIISLPLWEEMTPAHINYVVDSLACINNL